MKTTIHGEHCPVSLERVDRNVVKVYGGIVLSVLVLFLFTSHRWVVVPLVVDYGLRVFAGIRYSPVCILIRAVLKVSHIKPRMVDSERKRIAARFGLAFSLLTAVFYFAGYPLVSVVIASVFAVAVGLDLMFDFCLACLMHSWYRKFAARRKKSVS